MKTNLKACVCKTYGYKGCGFCTPPGPPVDLHRGDEWADDEGRRITIVREPTGNSVPVSVRGPKDEDTFHGTWTAQQFRYPWYRLVERNGKAVAA